MLNPIPVAIPVLTSVVQIVLIVLFATVVLIPVGAVLATFRPTGESVGQSVAKLLAFDPRHPQLSYVTHR